MFVRSSTPEAVPGVPVNNKRQFDTTNSSNFREVLAELSKQVSISKIDLPSPTPPKPQENIVKSVFVMDESIHKMDDAMLRDLLKGMVYEDITGKGDGPGGLLDLTEWIHGGPIRYSNTGELVTAESKTYFNAAASQYRSQKISVLETGLRNGTPLIEIYENLCELTSQQPVRFLGMMGYLVAPT
ncbi:hypothetical protein [Alcaligenes sp. SMD-FA]|uniref:hypothetical protein n=1 Tax=Alcaligenes sp. SMD-FA TaxID=2991054 RepID=UPI0022266E91|nr:hypothetical protein [Alcaligenes sp. SMD-FA]UYY87738.1 hypothetical protein OKX01_02175 [Alcaligenes sp. SMD-FA]